MRNRTSRSVLTIVIALMAGGSLAPHSRAAPFVPQTGTEVLERLRDRPLDASARELRQLRAELARDPQNLALATRMARRYIEEGRTQGDPRYLGYAQAALRPWWAQPQPPTPVLVLRATIRQSNHEFDAALEDLARVLKAAPNSGQAWLTRATVLQVRGEYAEAARSCEQLSRLAPEFVTATCLAGVASMTGQAETSYRLLVRTLQSMPSASPAEKVWIETALAEIAVRLGRQDAAESHFKQAFKSSTPDPYLKGAYADFLLDAGRPAEVVRLLAADARVDGLLLRLALAEQALGASELPARVANLQARFDAARARGDRVHMREEARFYSELRKQPAEALRLAQANWVVQKEPADARVLLEAALAASDRAAAQPVLDWMRENKVEDAALARLAQRLQQS